MNRVPSGIEGLDDILKGGLIAQQAYIVRGSPGVGKTIAGIHFVDAGMRAGESALAITLDQTQEQIQFEAETLGFNLESAAFLDLAPQAEMFSEMHTYDIFSPAEVERDPITRMISEKIDEVNPRRIFVDGFTQFRHLATDAFHLRRLVQSFFRFATRHATLLVSCDDSGAPDLDFQALADGVITLEFSGTSRSLVVTKFRGSDFKQGAHVMRLTSEGIVVLPSAA